MANCAPKGNKSTELSWNKDVWKSTSQYKYKNVYFRAPYMSEKKCYKVKIVLTNI